MKYSSLGKIIPLLLLFRGGDAGEVLYAKENGIEGEFIVKFHEKATRQRALLGEKVKATNNRWKEIMAEQKEVMNNMAEKILQSTGKNNLKANKIYAEAINGFLISGIDRSTVQKLADNEDVAYVEQNRVINLDDLEFAVQGGNSENGFGTPVSWGLDRVDQQDLPLDKMYSVSATGAGVTAYIIDTGVLISHHEFEGRASWGINTSGDELDADCHGHGTHVAGIVGGSTYGVAKDVNIVAVKILSCEGRGSLANVIEGIEWLIGDAVGKVATVNMSITSSGESAAFRDAVRNMHLSGIPVVAAAGNFNKDACDYIPGSYPEVITVGSTETDDSRASFSNHGSCVDIFAPGRNIESAEIGDNNNEVKARSGTSMSSPIVCGGVALLLEAGTAANNIATEIVNRATQNVLTNLRGSPNKMLYLGGIHGEPEGNLDGFGFEPTPTTDPPVKPPTNQPTNFPTDQPTTRSPTRSPTNHPTEQPEDQPSRLRGPIRWRLRERIPTRPRPRPRPRRWW